jgi:predicted NAD/FAD-binding protein
VPVRRVAIVGAGSAGLACAYALGRGSVPGLEVHVFDGAGAPGGVARTIELPPEALSAEAGPSVRSLNEGVQAAAPSYANVLALHRAVGFEPTPLSMKIAFGRGATAWSNVEPSPFTRRMRPQIARFGELLRGVHAAGPAATLAPIGALLRVGSFSAEFVHHMALPLVALFFGTGNQTHHVAASIVARVFLDEELRLFEYDPERLLASSPTMFAFDSLGAIYRAVAAASGARLETGLAVRSVSRAPDHVTLRFAEAEPRDFDAVVFACDAESALAALERPTLLERACLGGVRFFDDLTVTHTDLPYLSSRVDFDRARGDQYLVAVSADDPTQIEMSFDLTQYQPLLRGSRAPVLQTIFLDRRRRSGWSERAIDPRRVLARRWWRQLAPTWDHFARVTPLVRLLQGRHRTFYAGAWTLVNTHEVAVCSGFAAAERLGAPHPFAHDAAARRSYRLVRGVVHGS